jgi:hypothetical protein
MRRITFTLLVLVFFIFNASAQSNFSKVKIILNDQGIEQIARLGIDPTEGKYKKDTYLITDLSNDEINKLIANGIEYEIEIQDVSAFYAERAKKEMPTSIRRNTNDKWPVPDNFELGSMGGFYTLEEVMSEVDDMAAMYPDLISPRYTISTDTLTHEGRLMYWIRLSDNPEVDEDEPELLYSGVHHAREPIGVQQMIFYMWHLLENYATDTEIQLLVDNTEMYFVPVVNPDGYEYNHQTNPNGGGMLRKNRRNNGDGSYGVDLNRNYGYKWGYDDSGSSPYTSEETYRGPSAFSEPATKNMRTFCNEHNFRIALNYHSYSNLLLYPWGWTTSVTPDEEIFHSYAALMTKENGYTIGPASTTIYPTNGDSNDWMYGEQDSKDKIFAYVPEVGNSSDGFWPSSNRIIPLCQENMWQNLTAARLVGKYATLTETSPLVNNQIDGHIKYEIKRLGLTDTDEFTVSLTPLDAVIVGTGDNDSFLNMNLMQSQTDSISYSLDAEIENGTEFRFLLSVDNGSFTVSDTITKIFGTTVVIFIDEGEDMENWTSEKWQITTEDSYSPSTSFTDSKNSDYNDNQNNAITKNSVVDLSDASLAFLSFWAKWEIEAAYDYVQVMVKKENDNNWTALSGKYTKKGGNEYLNAIEPYYDGNSNWVNEEIDISDFAGEKINLRFVLVTDGGVKEDGFYFDNFQISVVSTETSINENNSSVFSSKAYPNPGSDKFTIIFKADINNENGKLQLFNSMGKLIKQQSFNAREGKLSLDTQALPNGIYYYCLTIEGRQSKVKKLIKINR